VQKPEYHRDKPGGVEDCIMKIQRRQMKVDIPSVAMGDIAFNLLVFFVILAQSQDDSHIQWTPAKADNLKGSGYTKVTVTIDKDQKLYLNGQELSEAQLAARIESNLGNAPAGQRKVMLKAHRDCTAAKFEPVIEAISQAGGELVHILEDKKKK
jgi:biopolymer transport protein ExbD